MGPPDDVRRLALDPFGELPTPQEVELVDLDGAVLSVNPWPAAQIVRPAGVNADGVAKTVETARAAGRDRGKARAGMVDHERARWPRHPGVRSRGERNGADLAA